MITRSQVQVLPSPRILVGYSVVLGRAKNPPIFKISVMNQYDLQPIPPEDRQRMKHYMIAAIFFILSLICSFFALSCSKEREQPKVTGAWNSVTYPSNYYLFHDDGIMEIHTLAAGQIVWQKFYTYEQDRINGALEVHDRNGMYFQGSLIFNQAADTVTMNQEGGLNIVLARW